MRFEPECRPREVTFYFSHPALDDSHPFELLVHAAMIEYVAACSSYKPFDTITPHPRLGFVASNGLIIELDWPGKHQVVTMDDLPADPTEEELALIAAEELAIAAAKPNPARGITK
jgi:hypothetical protein